MFLHFAPFTKKVIWPEKEWHQLVRHTSCIIQKPCLWISSLSLKDTKVYPGNFNFAPMFFLHVFFQCRSPTHRFRGQFQADIFDSLSLQPTTKLWCWDINATRCNKQCIDFRYFEAPTSIDLLQLLLYQCLPSWHSVCLEIMQVVHRGYLIGGLRACLRACRKSIPVPPSLVLCNVVSSASNAPILFADWLPLNDAIVPELHNIHLDERFTASASLCIFHSLSSIPRHLVHFFCQIFSTIKPIWSAASQQKDRCQKTVGTKTTQTV